MTLSSAKANSGTLEGQGELSDSNTGDTPFSVGRSPPQNGVERTSGTGGLGEGTPKVSFFFLFLFYLMCSSDFGFNGNHRVKDQMVMIYLGNLHLMHVKG